MKRSLNCLLFLLGCSATFSAYSESVFIAEMQLSISREAGRFGNNYSAEIMGAFPNSGYALSTEPVLRRTVNEFDIDLFIVGSNFFNEGEELLFPVSLVPFSRTVFLGELKDGIYSISLGYFLNGSQEGGLFQTFTVQNFSAITTPIPASIWLLLGSLLSLSLIRRRSN